MCYMEDMIDAHPPGSRARVAIALHFRDGDLVLVVPATNVEISPVVASNGHGYPHTECRLRVALNAPEPRPLSSTIFASAGDLLKFLREHVDARGKKILQPTPE